MPRRRGTVLPAGFYPRRARKRSAAPDRSDPPPASGGALTLGPRLNGGQSVLGRYSGVKGARAYRLRADILILPPHRARVIIIGARAAPGRARQEAKGRRPRRAGQGRQAKLPVKIHAKRVFEHARRRASPPPLTDKGPPRGLSRWQRRAADRSAPPA